MCAATLSITLLGSGLDATRFHSPSARYSYMKRTGNAQLSPWGYWPRVPELLRAAEDSPHSTSDTLFHPLTGSGWMILFRG